MFNELVIYQITSSEVETFNIILKTLNKVFERIKRFYQITVGEFQTSLGIIRTLDLAPFCTFFSLFFFLD